MDDAGLHPGLGEDGLDGVGEALEAVDAGDEDVVDAAALEVVEDGQPELGALGALEPQPQHVTLAVGVDADGQVAVMIAHRLAIADLHDQGVEIDDGVDGLQRAALLRPWRQPAPRW